MKPEECEDSSMTLDTLDRALLSALYADGRAAWPKIAEEIGSSTSTIRRRFELLQSRGLVRVIGRTDVARLGYGPPVIVKYRGRDTLRPEFLERLQNHPHVRYLASTVGSAYCLAEIVPQSLSSIRETLSDISHDFNASSESFVVTHTYTSGQDWLPDTAKRDIDVTSRNTDVKLSDEERKVLALLLVDGRASFASLAVECDKSESTVRRIVENLLDQDIVSLRVLVEPQVLGFQAMFWALMDIEPSRLPEAAHSLAANPATKTLFATAGSRNLIGQFVLPRQTDTYSFMTEILGELPGARSAETLVEAGTHKRVWNLVSGDTYSGVAGPDWLFGDPAR